MSKLNILVLSDLHVHGDDPSKHGVPSQYSSLPRYENDFHSPIRACEKVLENMKGQIDWLVCPGDLGDKNDAGNMNYAWRELYRLKKRLGIKHLIGTVGNHDVDSRRNDPNATPDSDLRRLKPAFPVVGQGSSNAKFWQHGYLIKRFTELDTTLCLLNTCSLHGIAGNDNEHEHGRVQGDVLEALQQGLPTALSSVNILVMHHHAHRHPWLPEDGSHAVNGLQLIEILKETGSRWLVIHGHRHLPELWYSGATVNSPIVLSSGSPSAKPYEVRGRTPRNQMHLVTIDSGRSANAPEELYGQIRSWSWANGPGWVMGNTRGDGLPSLCGFGRQGGLDRLADELVGVLEGSQVATLDWSNAAKKLQDIDYLNPDDFDAFQVQLERRGLLILSDHRFGIPQSIQRRT